MNFIECYRKEFHGNIDIVYCNLTIFTEAYLIIILGTYVCGFSFGHTILKLCIITQK